MTTEDRLAPVRESLVRELGEGPRALDYYLPVVAFLDEAIRHAGSRPLVVGVSGPQGSGKSTLVAHAVRELHRLGHAAAALSIDDFYLTRDEQLALAARYPENRYLEHRGYPGTHDTKLGEETIAALSRRDRGEVRVPSYDKGAHGGRGDRAPREAWPTITTPLDALLLEGWMLGFRALDDADILDPDLRAPNAALRRYDGWTRALGAFVHLDTADLDAIVRFRVDAERERRRTTGHGLSDEEARDYIERFLPAYRLYVPHLRERCPVDGPLLRVELGPDRLPIAPPRRT